MSTGSADEVAQSVEPNGLVRFTPRGEEALDALAAALTARCGGTPEGIAHMFDQVLRADLNELAGALTAIADASDERATVVGAGRARAAEIPDKGARRRVGRLR